MSSTQQPASQIAVLRLTGMAATVLAFWGACTVVAAQQEPTASPVPPQSLQARVGMGAAGGSKNGEAIIPPIRRVHPVKAAQEAKQKAKTGKTAKPAAAGKPGMKNASGKARIARR